MKLLALALLAALPLTACSSSVVQREVTPNVAHAPTGAYVVGGRVTGLRGIGLALRNARGEEVLVEDDGKFVFRTTLEDGAAFAISISREPISPAQTCSIQHATGRIAGKSSMETAIVCSALAFEDAPTPTIAPVTAAAAELTGGSSETKHATR